MSRRLECKLGILRVAAGEKAKKKYRPISPNLAWFASLRESSFCRFGSANFNRPFQISLATFSRHG